MVTFDSVEFPPATIGVLLVVVPFMGFMNRALNRLLPDYGGAHPKQRATALRLTSLVFMRIFAFSLDVWNAPEFFRNWNTPSELSADFYHILLINTALYTSMIVYEFAAYESNSTGLAHHTAVLLGSGALLIKAKLPVLFPHFLYLYRMGTLFGSPAGLVVAYFYLADNDKATMRNKMRVLRIGSLQYAVSVTAANIITVSFYIAHFFALPYPLRAILLFMCASMIPDQYSLTTTLLKWRRKISADLKRRLSEPVAKLKRKMSLVVPIGPIKSFGAEMRRRMSTSPVSPPKGISTVFNRNISLGSPISPIDHGFSPNTPVGNNWAMPMLDSRPSRPSSAINRRRPVHTLDTDRRGSISPLSPTDASPAAE
ncbi:hypothetical protein PhCBS80983_g01426 [Powellomyces hirtus]|uniref:TLC domain-containing protein n=1 Tax=Powellomyces hirtus TaxID=109895 RepID=A0A507ED23_9FUNG|nr:hypothetical protein PhCBS80983_g01426 [Powellomyces hirtus]